MAISIIGSSAEERRRDANELIEIPPYLLTPDGRKIHISKWAPVVGNGFRNTVTVEGYIVREEKLSPTQGE